MYFQWTIFKNLYVGYRKLIEISSNKIIGLKDLNKKMNKLNGF